MLVEVMFFVNQKSKTEIPYIMIPISPYANMNHMTKIFRQLSSIGSNSGENPVWFKLYIYYLTGCVPGDLCC